MRALDGATVHVSILRAKELRGRPVLREGTLQLVAPMGPALPIVGALPDQAFAVVLDEAGLAVATLLDRDALSSDFGPVRALVRPSFRIDVSAKPFDPLPEHLPTFQEATRDVAAELEAGFRADLIVRPDPDPAASIRADRGLPPIEEGPLRDGSVRFAVGHFSAALRPDGKGSIRLTCTETTIRGVRQIAARYEPIRGAIYALLPSEIMQLAADVRAFLGRRTERYRPLR